MRYSHLIGGSGGLVCYGTFGPGSGLPMVCCWLECDIVCFPMMLGFGVGMVCWGIV